MQHRFRNREGLLRAALERADARERNRWIDLTQGVDEPWERLLALLRNIIGMNPDTTVDPLWFQMLAVAQRDPSMHAVMRAQQDMWTLMFTQVIAAGYLFDAILLDSDPRDMALWTGERPVSAVFQGGRVVRAHESWNSAAL